MNETIGSGSRLFKLI